MRKNRWKYVEGKQESPKKVNFMSKRLFFNINASPKFPVLLRIKCSEKKTTSTKLKGQLISEWIMNF